MWRMSSPRTHSRNDPHSPPPPLPPPQPHGASRRVHPAVGDLPHTTHRERRRRLAPEREQRRAGGKGAQRVQPQRHDEREIGSEHRVEPPGDREAQQPDGGRRGPGPQRAARRQDHAVGASVLSRIALSATSGVTPSSSSSGATLTRWRNTAGARPFTSSGTTKSRSSTSAAARAALSSDTPARGLAPSVSDAASRVARTIAVM